MENKSKVASAKSPDSFSSKSARRHRLSKSAYWQRMRIHKLFGVPIATSCDGKVIMIAAEDIEIPEEELKKPLKLPTVF